MPGGSNTTEPEDLVGALGYLPCAGFVIGGIYSTHGVWVLVGGSGGQRCIPVTGVWDTGTNLVGGFNSKHMSQWVERPQVAVKLYKMKHYIYIYQHPAL